MLDYWVITVRGFLEINSLNWRLMDTLAFIPDPELVYIRLLWWERLINTLRLEGALTCKPDPK